jgi:putative protein-disulfide isomerase
VIPHDRRIAQITGQPFGQAYFEGLLRDTSAVFDSTPPIAAILAADKLAGRGLDLISRLQTAHYVEGRRIADSDVLVEMAGVLGLDAAAFSRALNEMQGGEVQLHIAATRRLMERIGARGFPSFALERDAQVTLLDTAAYLGRPEALQDWLKTQVPAKTSAEAATEFGCGPESCSI